MSVAARDARGRTSVQRARTQTSRSPARGATPRGRGAGARRPSSRPLPPPPRRRRWGWLLALLVIALLVGWSLRPQPQVGGFTSAQGHDRYQMAYAEALRELPPRAATMDLRTDHGVVRVYRLAGANAQRPPVVLLADRGRAAPHWAPLIAELVRQRTVYAIDTLGDAGMSLQSRPLRSDSDAANWLDQVLGQLPGNQFVLIGAGTGGWLATNLAVRRPVPVAGLVLLDPERVIADPPVTADAVRWVAAESGRPAAWQQSWLEQRDGVAPSGGLGRLALSGMAEHVDGSWIGDPIAERQLRELRPNTLILLGGSSTLQDLGSARVRGKLIPRVGLRVLPGSPHDLISTRPAEVRAELTRFLAAG